MSAIHLSSALVCAKVKGLILENTFTSIPDMVDVVMPWVAPMKSLVLRIGWHSKARIPAITAPILFVSGRRDELVPPAHMDALLAAARTSLYTVMHKVPEGKHNDTWQVPFLIVHACTRASDGGACAGRSSVVCTELSVPPRVVRPACLARVGVPM